MGTLWVYLIYKGGADNVAPGCQFFTYEEMGSWKVACSEDMGLVDLVSFL